MLAKFLNRLVLTALVLGIAPSIGSAQAVVTYNAANGQLSIDTTGGVGGAGFNLVSVKIPGPQASSIDRWSDATTQDGVDFWVQEFTTNSNNGVTAEQWVGLDAGGASSPNAAVAPGVYQIATYSPGLTLTDFTGDADSGIAAGSVELGGFSSSSTPGSTEMQPINFVTGLPCDFVAPTGCNILDIDALYAGTNGAPAPLTDAAIATWLTQASDVANPLKASTSHVYVSGDVDLDGDVDSTDLGLLLNNFSSTAGLNWGAGNLNSDPNVDSTDLGLLLNNFSFTSAATSAVPEPSSSLLIVFAVLGLVAASRKNNTP